jgi:hypothetical protein
MSEDYFVDAKVVASGGYLHLLQAPFGAAAAIEHCPNVPLWSDVAVVVAQAQYWSLHSQRGKEKTTRISVMH